eukprot:SAG11_NODE_1023_length_6154_cov_3.841288_5_plen_225_part_00
MQHPALLLEVALHMPHTTVVRRVVSQLSGRRLRGEDKIDHFLLARGKCIGERSAVQAVNQLCLSPQLAHPQRAEQSPPPLLNRALLSQRVITLLLRRALCLEARPPCVAAIVALDPDRMFVVGNRVLPSPIRSACRLRLRLRMLSCGAKTFRIDVAADQMSNDQMSNGAHQRGEELLVPTCRGLGARVERTAVKELLHGAVEWGLHLRAALQPPTGELFQRNPP